MVAPIIKVAVITTATLVCWSPFILMFLFLASI